MGDVVWNGRSVDSCDCVVIFGLRNRDCDAALRRNTVDMEKVGSEKWGGEVGIYYATTAFRVRLGFGLEDFG